MRTIITVLFLTPFFLLAQYTPVSDVVIGSSGSDQVICFVKNANSTYVLSNSNGASDFDKNVTLHGGGDVWLIKLDNSNNIIWQIGLGGDLNDFGEEMIVLSNGNMLICIQSNSDISGNRTVALKGYQDIWLVEIDQSGNIVNQTSIGGDDTEYIYDLQLTADDFPLLLLSTNSTGTGGLDLNETYYNQPTTDPWVVKIDNQLDIVEQKRLTQGAPGGSGNPSAMVIKDNSIYIAASSSGETGGVKSDSSFDTGTGPFYKEDYWVIHLNQNLQVLNDATYGSVGIGIVSGINITNDNKLIITGVSEGGVSGNKTSSKISNGLYLDTWLIVLDANLNKVKDKMYGNSGELFSQSKLYKINNDRFIFSGSVECLSDLSFSNVSFYGGAKDAFLMTIDQNADIMDLTAIGTPGDESIVSLLYDNGTLYLGGASDYTGISTFHSENGRGDLDNWFLELTTTVSVEEIKNNTEDVYSIYPNPSSSELFISTQGDDIKVIELFTVTGQKVKEFSFSNSKRIQLLTNDIKDGLYLLKISSEKNIVTKKVRIIH